MLSKDIRKIAVKMNEHDTADVAFTNIQIKELEKVKNTIPNSLRRNSELLDDIKRVIPEGMAKLNLKKYLFLKDGKSLMREIIKLIDEEIKKLEKEKQEYYDTYKK